MIGPFDQNTNLGLGSRLCPQHPDLVIGQADIRDGRIDGSEALPQTNVKSVHRALPDGRRRMNVLAHTQSDAGGCDRFLAGRETVGASPVQLSRDLVANDNKGMKLRMRRLPDQQLEGAFGRLKVVTLMLHVLHAVEQGSLRRVVELLADTELLQLVTDIAPAGKIAQENALPIADRLRFDVFVGCRVL